VIIIDAQIKSKGNGAADDGEAPVIISLVGAAMQLFTAAIDALPDTKDPEFSERAAVILSGLRKLQTALTKAASRGRATPSVIVSLAGVRQISVEGRRQRDYLPGQWFSGLSQTWHRANLWPVPRHD
jgi:hypothetical protein